MRKKCLFNIRVFREQIVDYRRMVCIQLWPFYFRPTQCNEGDNSELLQPLYNTQMVVYLPLHSVPTMHLSLSPVWITLIKKASTKTDEKQGDFFNCGKKQKPFW